MVLKAKTALVAAVLLLTACGSTNGPTDTGLDTGDGFGDVKSFCLDGFRVFITQEDFQATSAIAVIDDPKCAALS